MDTLLVRLKWEDYLFLTIEMKKFLKRHDLPMFFSLVEQRETLQGQLEQISDKAYNASPDGREMLTKVQQANQEMMDQFHFIFNVMKKQKDVSQTYEGMASTKGSFINRNT